MSAERKTEHVPEWKREEVADLVDLVERFESVGVVDVRGIPSRQLQEMRADLYGTAEIRMSRNTLIERALETADEGVEALEAYVSGHVGLIGTDDNAFSLFRRLESSKTSAPISAGEVAPNDIVVPEGDTGIDPGPFVGDLQNVGASAQIMEGSIRVTEDSLVAEEGDVVSEDLADVLSELGIEPKEVGLDLRAVYADGVLFESDDLDIDIEDYRADVETATARAHNLSIDAAYPTDRTTGALLAKASGEAKSVGLQAEVESPDIVDDLVSTADVQVRALAARIDDEEALPEELRDVDVAASETEEETPEESTDEEPDAETEAGDEADEEDEDEDENAGADALGDMFE